MAEEWLERLKRDAEDHASGQFPDDRALREHAADLGKLITAYEERGEVLESLIKEACNMLSTLGDQMHETAEDRHEIEEFIRRAASAME